MPPSVSILIPTRGRPVYLEVALSSIAPQARVSGAEVVVIEDGRASTASRELCHRLGARYLAHGLPRGLNVARNTAVQHSCGALVAFVDDDVRVHRGWLQALMSAAEALPETDVFTGPILARLEGAGPRSCGREGAPITHLDLGAEDADTRYAWGANMLLRRTALERVGPFDVSLENAGDEQEWQDRLAAAGGRPARYVARAALDHRRTGHDARLGSLTRAGRVRGRASRRFDTRRGEAPSLARELIVLGGCLGHVLRYRCPAGLVMVAHSAGRTGQAFSEWRGAATAHGISQLYPQATQDQPPPVAPVSGSGGQDFLSGHSGTVGGLDGARRAGVDRWVDACELLSGQRWRLRRAARREPPRRRVLILGVHRTEHRDRSAAIESELRRSRHELELHTAEPGALGKFENLNLLLARHPPAGHDWLLVVDDDVSLPHGFLDRFLFLAERFGLELAQPAHRLNSHAAWEVTRRRRRSSVREVGFVEIGPVTAFAARTFPLLLPFPALKMGWGLDLHWSAVAAREGWRCGIVDAVSIAHRAAPAAEAYSRVAAIAEAEQFLSGRPYLPAVEAARTLRTHRRW